MLFCVAYSFILCGTEPLIKLCTVQKKNTNRRVSLYWKCIALVKGFAAFLQYLYDAKKGGGMKKSSLKLTFQLLGNVPGMAANNSCCTRLPPAEEKPALGEGKPAMKAPGPQENGKFFHFQRKTKLLASP